MINNVCHRQLPNPTLPPVPFPLTTAAKFPSIANHANQPVNNQAKQKPKPKEGKTMRTPLQFVSTKRNTWAIIDADGKPILCHEGALISADEAEDLTGMVNAGYRHLVSGPRMGGGCGKAKAKRK
jgi:hypothetical protein